MNPNKALWEKGDFTRIARCMRESGEALVAALGTVFIDNAQLPLEQVIWFGAIVLVAACSCANAARWFPAAPKPLTWGTEEDWSDVDLDWGGDRRR